MSLKWLCELAHVLGIFCVQFLTSLLWWWIFAVGFWTLCIQTKFDWCLKSLFLSLSSSIKTNVFLAVDLTSTSLDLCVFLCVCAGWPFRWISLILTACPWRTTMHCEWPQYANRKRRDSKCREGSSTARWTSTGLSYPLLKAAVLITLTVPLKLNTSELD